MTYAGFPVIDWTLQITNLGNSDSPVIEDLQGLNHFFVRPAGEDREFILRHSKGSRAAAVDFWPSDNMLGPGAKFTMGGHGGRPSDYSFPFMNLSWGSGGAIMAVGWSGQWMSQFERDDKDSLHVRTGLEYFHAKLHPGEGIRSPRILLTFWDGEDSLRGHNLFRQFMLSYGIPKIDGKHLVPPIAASFSGLNDYTESNQVDVAPKYGNVGIEAQWIDAGWVYRKGGRTAQERGSQNRRIFRTVWVSVGEAIHAAGMKFVSAVSENRTRSMERDRAGTSNWVIGPISYPNMAECSIGEFPPARQCILLIKCRTRFDLGHVDNIFREILQYGAVMIGSAMTSPIGQGMTEMRFCGGHESNSGTICGRAIRGLWDRNLRQWRPDFDLETVT